MTRQDYIHLFKEACADKCNAEYNPCAYRQAADLLAALKPVAWINPKNNFVIDNKKKIKIGSGAGYDNFSAPLYELDEVKA